MLRDNARLFAKLILLIGTGGWLLLYGMLTEPRNLRVTETEAVLPAWSAQAAPARILLLADIHAALWDGDWLDRVVETSVALEPEAIFLLGDYCFTSGKRCFAMPPEQVGRHLAPLGKRCPVYFVTGNHDLFPEVIGIQQVLTRRGFISLQSGKDKEIVFANGCRLRLRGGAFVSERDTSPALNKRFRPEKEGQHAIPLMSVIHNPYHFLRRNMAGDIIVSGHTHGGQICRPGRLPIRRQGPMSTEWQRGGWHRAGSGKPLYISRGIGTTLLPLRYNCPPEITLLIFRGKDE